MSSFLSFFLLYTTVISQDVIWQELMDGSFTGWSEIPAPALATAETGANCPSGGSCWYVPGINGGGRLITRTEPTTRYTNISVAFDLNAVGVTGSKSCSMQYSIDSGSSWSADAFAATIEQEYSESSIILPPTANLNDGVGIQFTSESLVVSCYWANLIVSGIKIDVIINPIWNDDFLDWILTKNGAPLSDLSLTGLVEYHGPYTADAGPTAEIYRLQESFACFIDANLQISYKVYFCGDFDGTEYAKLIVDNTTYATTLSTDSNSITHTDSALDPICGSGWSLYLLNSVIIKDVLSMNTFSVTFESNVEHPNGNGENILFSDIEIDCNTDTNQPTTNPTLTTTAPTISTTSPSSITSSPTITTIAPTINTNNPTITTISPTNNPSASPIPGTNNPSNSPSGQPSLSPITAIPTNIPSTSPITSQPTSGTPTRSPLDIGETASPTTLNPTTSASPTADSPTTLLPTFGFIESGIITTISDDNANTNDGGEAQTGNGSNSSIGIIIGVIAAVLAIAVIIIIIVLWWKRKKKQNRRISQIVGSTNDEEQRKQTRASMMNWTNPVHNTNVAIQRMTSEADEFGNKPDDLKPLEQGNESDDEQEYDGNQTEMAPMNTTGGLPITDINNNNNDDAESDNNDTDSDDDGSDDSEVINDEDKKPTSGGPVIENDYNEDSSSGGTHTATRTESGRY